MCKLWVLILLCIQTILYIFGADFAKKYVKPFFNFPQASVKITAKFSDRWILHYLFLCVTPPPSGLRKVLKFLNGSFGFVVCANVSVGGGVICGLWWHRGGTVVMGGKEVWLVVREWLSSKWFNFNSDVTSKNTEKWARLYSLLLTHLV